jgi:hypothetical protein
MYAGTAQRIGRCRVLPFGDRIRISSISRPQAAQVQAVIASDPLSS